MYKDYEIKANQISEKERSDAYWKHKEIKSYCKLVRKCRNRAIPPESRKKLYQVLCQMIHTTLPNQVQIFELIPDKIYSVKNVEDDDIWTMYNVDKYMQELTGIMHPNAKNSGKRKAMFFEDDFVGDLELNEIEKLKAYAKIFKIANGTYIPSEKKEYLYQNLGEIIMESCPKNVKEFVLDENLSIQRNIQEGESWCIDDFKEYIKELETY